MSKPKRPPNPPSHPKLGSTLPKPISPPLKTTLLAWIGLLGCTIYSLFFYASTLGETSHPDGSPLALTRLHTLFMLLVPEETWRIWSNDHAMPVGITDRLPLCLAAMVWLAIAHYFGRTILQLCHLWSSFNRIERSGLAFATGLQLLSWLTMILGMLGLIGNRWWLSIAILMLLAVAWLLRQRNPLPVDPKASSLNPQDPVPSRRWTWLAVVGIGMSLLILAGAILPPLEFDVREYHLQAPKEFALQGRITFLPHNVYANMPLGAEMHSLSWMVLLGTDHLQSEGWYSGALIGKLIIASFSIITAMILGGMLARELHPLAGWVAAIAYLSSPGIAEVSRLGLIDAALGCYAIACFACLNLAWKERQGSLGLTILLGWLLGAAIGCKYTAIPMIALPVLVIWLASQWPSFRTQFTQTLARSWLLIAVLCLSSGAWYLKNAIYVGNPVYPLAGNLFPSDPRTNEQVQQWNAAHRVPPVAHGPEAHADYRPQRLLQDIFVSLIGSRYLGAMLVPLAILGWCSRRNRLNSLSLGWALWMFVVWWSSTHRLERFLLPAYPIVAIGAGLGISRCMTFLRGIPLDTGLALGSLYALQLVATMPMTDVRILVTLDALRYDRYLDNVASRRMQIVPRVAPHQRWLNDHLQPTDLVLMVGDAQVFDLQVPCLYSTCFDRSPIDDLLSLPTPSDQRRWLQDRGITHIAVHWGEIARYRQPGNYGFSSNVAPTRLTQCVESQVLRPVHWPILSETADLYEVLSDASP